MKNKRLTLVIGASNHDDSNISTLIGAKNDADRIFSLLTSHDYGDYDDEHSIKLISPTFIEYTDAIDKILFTENNIDVFTFYFAGHGGIKDGNYYLCLKDTNLQKMSMTSISLNSLFQFIHESRPRETNIIIDACQSTGFLNNLQSLINVESLKNNTSLKFNILVSCGMKQIASEVNGNGLFTSELIKYISGTKEINNNTEYLDLNMIHKKIYNSSNILDYNEQNALNFSLNFGESSFTSNPFFKKNPHISKLIFTSDEYVNIESKIIKHWDIIFEEYQKTKTNPDPIRLSKVLEEIIENDISSIPLLINGLESNLISRATESNDYFADITIISCLISKLLSFSNNAIYIDLIKNLINKRKYILEEKISILLKNIKSNKNCLISNDNDPFSEIYYLPIRISKILGVLWSQILINKNLNADNNNYNKQVKEYTEIVFSIYQESFICISEEQAPYIYLMDIASNNINEDTVMYNVLNKYFENIIKSKAYIASINISIKDIPLFLEYKEQYPNSFIPKLLSNPSELLSVMMLLKNNLINKTSWNKEMIALDYKNNLIFIPDSYDDFNKIKISKGINYVNIIGKDIWTLEEFSKIFTKKYLDIIKKSSNNNNEIYSIICIITALTFPNRIPWIVN